MPDLLQQKLSALPARPGCYLLKGASGAILYFGKAVSLRSRVRSYFRVGARHTPRTSRLVAHVTDFEVIVTSSEPEALVLECTLIKRHQPRYNIRLRDDKPYPYLCLTVTEPFPRLIFVRRARQDGNRYYGPFPSSKAVHPTQDVFKVAAAVATSGRTWWYPVHLRTVNVVRAYGSGVAAGGRCRLGRRHAGRTYFRAEAH